MKLAGYSMSDLFDEVLREKYRQYLVNDLFAFAKESIDWNAFPPLLNDLYHNDTDNSGRPNVPVKTMIKVLFLQSMFNMVDKDAEISINDRVSFMNFLDFPNQYLDARIHGYSVRDYQGPERSLVEYPHAIIKRMFHFSHVMVAIVIRLRVKFMFACFAYNVHVLKVTNILHSKNIPTFATKISKQTNTV